MSHDIFSKEYDTSIHSVQHFGVRVLCWQRNQDSGCNLSAGCCSTRAIAFFFYPCSTILIDFVIISLAPGASSNFVGSIFNIIPNT